MTPSDPLPTRIKDMPQVTVASNYSQQLPFQMPLTEAQLTMPEGELVATGKLPLTILPDTGAVYRWMADAMATELAESIEAGEPLRWVLPVGPKDHYAMLAEICNRRRLSWADVWAFHMDEWCDWEGRPLPPEHPYSFKGFMQRELYDRLDPELRPPAEQVVYPEVGALDAFSEQIVAAGGIDTTYAGFGARGHVAFNESPVSRWSEVTAEQLRRGRTRLVQLADDSMVAHSHRSAGGNTFAIPPMAVTIGMADILGSRKLRLVTDGGAWKQFILRMLLLGEEDARFPVTLCQSHPDCTVTVDAASARPARFGL
jgi:glucosamine-6-phosphate deaminase